MSQRSTFRLFLRNITIIIIIVIISILVLQNLYNDYLRVSLSKSYISELVSRAEDKFQNFYKPIEGILIISGKWGESGLLEVSNVKSLNSRFMPILELIDQIHSVKITGNNRSVYSLTKEKNFWTSQLITKKDKQSILFEQKWSDDGDLIAEHSEETDYNPHIRPWYTGAKNLKKPDEVYWTTQRTILSAQNQGITASISWHTKNKPDSVYVLAYDILLNQIFLAVSKLRVSGNGRAFLYRDVDGSIFRLATSGLPPEYISDSSGYFVDYNKMTDPLITQAISDWQSREMSDEDPIRLTNNSASFWVGLRPIDRGHTNLWIGVIVPENDFLAEFKQRQQYNYLISFIVLIFGGITAWFIIKKYRKQLVKDANVLSRDDDFENSVRKIINGGESETIEFKSTIRMNLKTGESGKEIEIAWLKSAVAFMNSVGGILFFGINDNGDIIGLEADQFENDDKCLLHFKNLINQHIGAEFSRFLNFRTFSLDEKPVAFLECSPSPKPVFLEIKNEEHFYIRSGPSSIKLQTSKVLEYLDNRKSH